MQDLSNSWIECFCTFQVICTALTELRLMSRIFSAGPMMILGWTFGSSGAVVITLLTTTMSSSALTSFSHVAPSSLAYLLVGIVVAIAVQWLYLPVRRLFSPLHLLPGPKSETLIWGNMSKVLSSSELIIYDQWAETYGPVFAYRVLFGDFRAVILDVHALTFIMTQTDIFYKSQDVRQFFTDFVGKGLLVAESDDHKRQRRIMNPSFAWPHIRALLPIFWQKALQLKDVFLSTLKSNPQDGMEINILPLISHASLDIIGAAGFDHHFNSLDDHEDELAAAFRKGFESPATTTSTLSVINRLVPGTRSILLDPSIRVQVDAAKVMRQVGAQIVEQKKALVADEVKTGSTAQARDLLTLLIKSNMAPENEGQRMSDDEVLAQISTFLFAGHVTTSVAASWALYELARHPDVQHKLRQELLESRLGDEPDMVDLDKLPYLDSVVRETLRLHPAVYAAGREAMRDVHVPLSQPYKDRNGVERKFVQIQKGDVVMVPVMAMNRKKDIWGEDGAEFRPERWDNLPEAAKDIPGVWGNIMTFFQGKHSCIGFRFAVAEIKVLVYTLVCAIEFDVEPGIQMESKSFSARPLVVSHPEKGNQMPLKCKLVATF